MSFVRVGSVWVRAESIYAVAPNEQGSTVYAGGTVFSDPRPPEEFVAVLGVTGDASG